MNAHYKFKAGDRVVRLRNVYDENSELMHGTVLCRYALLADTGILNLGDYHELYCVRWDDEKVDNGYLPHGLDWENSVSS